MKINVIRYEDVVRLLHAATKEAYEHAYDADYVAKRYIDVADVETFEVEAPEHYHA